MAHLWWADICRTVDSEFSVCGAISEFIACPIRGPVYPYFFLHWVELKTCSAVKNNFLKSLLTSADLQFHLKKMKQIRGRRRTVGHDKHSWNNIAFVFQQVHLNFKNKALNKLQLNSDPFSNYKKLLNAIYLLLLLNDNCHSYSSDSLTTDTTLEELYLCITKVDTFLSKPSINMKMHKKLHTNAAAAVHLTNHFHSKHPRGHLSSYLPFNCLL